MALRLGSLPWDSQPQEAFAPAPGVDYVASGLLTTGTALSIVGTTLPVLAPTDRGVAWSFIGTSGSYVGGLSDVVDLFPSTGGGTVHILARRKAISYAFSMVGRGDATNKGWSIGWAGSSGGYVLYGTVTHGTTDCKVTTTAAASPGTWHLITMRLSGAPTVAGTLQIFIDGAPAGGTSTAATGTHATDSTVPLRIGSAAYGGFSGYTNAFEGEIALFAAHRYAQSDAEIAAIAANPWRVIEPQRIFTPVIAAAGSSVSVPLATLTASTFQPAVSTPNAVSVAAASVSIAAFAPAVSTPNAIAIPAASLALSAPTPVITVGAGQFIAVPAASIAASALTPTVTAGGSVAVAVPAATVGAFAYAPSVFAGSGASISVPLGAVSITAMAPSVQTKAPDPLRFDIATGRLVKVLSAAVAISF